MSKLQELIKVINRKMDCPDEQAKYIEKFIESFASRSQFWCVSPWVGKGNEYPETGKIGNNVSCLYIFTDMKIASTFGTAYGLTSPDKKNVLTMSFPMTAFKDMLEQYMNSGIQAIVIDCGGDNLCVMIDGLLKVL